MEITGEDLNIAMILVGIINNQMKIVAKLMVVIVYGVSKFKLDNGVFQVLVIGVIVILIKKQNKTILGEILNLL